MVLDPTGYPNVATALAATFERVGGWRAWVLKARAELDYEKREAIYHQGIQQFPDSWELYTHFADFMENQRQKRDEAAQLFRKAFALNPNDALTAGNLGEFLVIYDRRDEAIPLLQQAWKLNTGKPNELSGAVALNIGIAERCASRDDTQALGRLKTLLLDSFERGVWFFDAVLESVKATPSVEDHTLYSALAKAILDANQVTALDSFERWRSVAPIPLDQPWEVKAG
jgi:tetratricopeptide (TPR) repeat protein